MIIGHLDTFSSGRISGWLGSFTGETFPFITANGKPCRVICANLPRADVTNATGLDAATGFIAEVPHSEYSSIEFKLYAISASGAKLITSKSFTGAAINPKRFCSVFDALDIARQEHSVAITYRDASNEGIIRAYALYKIAASQRPAVIIAFDIELSQPGLWQPLINSDVKILVVPWRERETYFNLFKEIGFSFNTVWICNADYQVYELSRHIANEKTCFIQDMDYNLYSHSHTDDSNSKFAQLMGRSFFEKIPQRSLSCATLSESSHSIMIRQARSQNAASADRQTDLTQEVRVGYIGTITPETGLIAAAKVIGFINRSHGYRIKLCVRGIFLDTAIKNELECLQCEVIEGFDLCEMNHYVQYLDVVITGFPLDGASENETQHHVAPLIGDALCNSRPVLVPTTSAIDDLKNIGGVYLFSQETFAEQLTAAIKNVTTIALNEHFSIEINYQKFKDLEQQAKLQGPSYKELFGHVHQPVEKKPIPDIFEKENIVLVWKQHDAGLYGRRVDQIARSLANDKHYKNVISLEIITKEQLRGYKENGNKIESDQQYIYSDYFNKQSGLLQDGIVFQTILSDDTENFSYDFNRFIIDKKLFPTNTIFILFPAITEFTQLLTLIDGYKSISDIVDNQLSWEAHSHLPLLNQYLTFNCFSENVIFNSEENLNFFISKGLSPQKKVSFVPNWYTLPISYTAPLTAKEADLNILYSGNMNDRIDWQLLKSLHDNSAENVRINLIGTLDKASNELIVLLETGYKFVYHGPMRERDLLKFASTCKLAIMPHTIDKHSTYMNPMKLNMYSALGLCCVSTNIPGIDKGNPYLIICTSTQEFVGKTIELLENAAVGYRSDTPLNTDRAKIYIDTINSVAHSSGSHQVNRNNPN